MYVCYFYGILDSLVSASHSPLTKKKTHLFKIMFAKIKSTDSAYANAFHNESG